MGNIDNRASVSARECRPATLDVVLDETSDIILIIDNRLRIRESSRVAQAILGLPSDDGRGLPLSDFLSNKDEGALEAVLSSPESRAGNLCVESSLKQPDGGSFRARFTTRPLAKEGRARGWTLLVGSRIDASEEAGARSRFQPLVDRVLKSYADPALVIDAASRTIRACNDSAVSALGYARAELVGRSLDRFSESREFSEEPMKSSRFAVSQSGVFQTKIRLRKKDETVRSFACMNVALFDDRGFIESVLCILHDRSDEEARMAELFRLTEDADIISKRLDALTAGFSNSRASPTLSERGLTRRQIEIVALVVSGSPTKAIARKLDIAEVTVKGHLSLVYHRLNVKSRTDLLRFIHESGFRLE
jgi:PAS domain-containing protein